MTYAQLYITESDGWRNYLTISEGRKWVRLICTEDAKPVKLPKAQYADIARCAKPLQVKPSRLARRLRAIAKDYGLEKTSAVADALAMLKRVAL